MSEVLQMVNGIIESSSSDNSNIPSKNVSRVEVLHDAEINKKRTMDQKPGESNWFVRMWRPKLVRTC
jgi:hypothetical protein